MHTGLHTLGGPGLGTAMSDLITRNRLKEWEREGLPRRLGIGVPDEIHKASWKAKTILVLTGSPGSFIILLGLTGFVVHLLRVV